jgi:hypothetical protein
MTLGKTANVLAYILNSNYMHKETAPQPAEAIATNSASRSQASEIARKFRRAGDRFGEVRLVLHL